MLKRFVRKHDRPSPERASEGLQPTPAKSPPRICHKIGLIPVQVFPMFMKREQSQILNHQAPRWAFLLPIESEQMPQLKLGRAGEAIRGGLLNFLEGGAPIRSGLAGLLEGDLEPLKQAIGYGQPFPQLTPEQMSSQAFDVAMDINNPMQNMGGLLGVISHKAKGIPAEALRKKIIPGLNNLPQSPAYDAAGNLYDDMAAKITKLDDGSYLGTYAPPWGSKSKDFYAVGDNVDELATYLLKRNAKSDNAIASHAVRKAEKSLVGQLKKQLGDTDDAFEFARSTQSKSEYITYKPTGTKIRISDHDLPLHYEQPDVDLRSWMTDEDKVKSILKAIK
jgi:hypothetical protein